MTVRLLPFDPEVIDRLQLLGLDRLRDVARLTLPELQSQFGFAGRAHLAARQRYRRRNAGTQAP